MYTKKVRIDVTPGGEPKIIHISQYDSASRTITFELFSNDAEFTLPSGATAEINGTKPDGNGFSKLGTISDNTVAVELTEQMAAVAGRVPCKLAIEQGGKKLLTEKFILMVDRAALDKDTLSSESEIRQLVEIADNLDEIIEASKSISDTVEATQAAALAAAGSAASASEAAGHAVGAKEAISGMLDGVLDKIDALDDKADELSREYNRDIDAISAAKQDALGNIKDKTQQVLNFTSKSDLVAAQALAKANNLENDVAEALNTTQSLKEALQVIMNLANSKVDDGYADSEGYLHLTANGEDTGNRIGPFAANGSGGGGSGSGNNASMSMTNNTGWMTKTIASGDECPVSLTWSSIEEEMETGPGALQISSGGVVRATLQVSQGYVSVDISPYLQTGSNSVDIRITDVYGNSRHVMFTVTVIALFISSTFDAGATYNSVIQFPYTPTGGVPKTVHFILDGKEIGTAQTSVSGRQMTYTIPAQEHGAHSLRCYFEAEINYQTVRSNELYFEFVCVEALGTDPVITSSFNHERVAQYTSIVIPFSVYDPANVTAEVKIYANNVLVSTQTVDRKEQTYTYRANETGNLKIRFVSGTASKEITIIVEESAVDVEAETENLVLYLTSQGRSNNEENPANWISDAGSQEVKASLTGFGWTSDGWQNDEDGVTCLRVSGGAKVEIPFKPFTSDARRTGLTFEIEYATRNVSDYGATILSCKNGGRGLEITPQRATLNSEQTELYMQYKEGEHIRLAYTIDKRSENRLVRSYINGRITRVAQYPDDDDFSQAIPVGISIGSDKCTIDIYCIRVYTNNLTRHQILDNWIADTQDGGLMLERYTRNQVYDAYGQVVIAQIPNNLPYMIIEAEELPQFKGDKKTVSGSYTDPLHPSKSFTFAEMQINVQGTSSAPYYRKNYDMQFKGGFEMITSGHADTYKLRNESIPTARFVGKANVASSEMANNTELARLYNDICPYKTPEMEADSRVRWGIDGFPIVVFWHDVVSGQTKYLGNYDFNFPKRFPEGYGYTA